MTTTEPRIHIIRDMDNRKVDTYALSMTNPLVYWAPPGFGLELAGLHLQILEFLGALVL